MEDERKNKKSEERHEPAISHIGPPTRANINSLKALCTLAPPGGQEGYWCVYSYVLNRDICKEDGMPDNIYGKTINLGVYPNKEKALARARHITETIGHRTRAAPLCYWNDLLLDPHPQRTTWVNVDTKGNLVEFENQKFRHQQELYRKRLKEEKAALEEQERELDPNEISHYKYQWLLAIQGYARLQEAKKKMELIEETYQKRVRKIQDHFSRIPEHDEKWLDYLKTLSYTEDHVECIRTAYMDLRKPILGQLYSTEEETTPKPSLHSEEEQNSFKKLAETLPIPPSLEKEEPKPTTSSAEIEDLLKSPPGTAEIESISAAQMNSAPGTGTDYEWHTVGKNKRRRARRGKGS